MRSLTCPCLLLAPSHLLFTQVPLMLKSDETTAQTLLLTSHQISLGSVLFPRSGLFGSRILPGAACCMLAVHLLGFLCFMMVSQISIVLMTLTGLRHTGGSWPLVSGSLSTSCFLYFCHWLDSCGCSEILLMFTLGLGGISEKKPER